MAKKKRISSVEKATLVIPGFEKLWTKVQRRIVLSQHSPNTLSCYGGGLAQIALHFGRSPVEVDKEEMQQFLYELVKKKRRSVSYLKIIVYSLHYAYRTLGFDSSHLELPTFPHKTHLPAVLSKQECQRLLATPVLLKHRVILALIYSTGLRMNEARLLKLKDIDADRMQIHVRQGKGCKDRYVTLSKILLRLLKQYYKKCKPQVYLFNGQNPREPLGQRTMASVLNQSALKAELTKDVSLHTLRHSFATHLLEDGVDLISIKEQLGHSQVQSTMIYLHIARVRKSLPHSPLDTLYRKQGKY